MYYNNGKIENGEWKNDEFQKKGFFWKSILKNKWEAKVFILNDLLF